jgi:hypothetical protein
MVQFDARTNFGRFRIKINDKFTINFETRTQSKIGSIITVGGRHSCVSIEIFDNSDTAHFLNVKRTNGGCELDEKEIKGPLTVKMICLAFTITKQIASHVTKITLEDSLCKQWHSKIELCPSEDMSDFGCKRRDGTIVGVSLALHDLMFKQMTWYEGNFKAKLLNNDLYDSYIKDRNNFNKKPPIDFDFRNNDLNIALKPALIAANSWKEFFTYINNEYKDNKCDIIFPWYKQAISLIFEGINYERQNWIITLTDIPDCISIEYIEENKFAGGNRTRKRNISSTIFATWDDFDYLEHLNHSYKWLLK